MEDTKKNTLKKEFRKGIEKGNSTFKEFKKFISKGNVVDMAVGVIIGSAFGKIVTSLVENIFMPLIGIIIGKVDFSSLLIKVGDTEIKYGVFIQNVVDFLIVALCIFTMVKVISGFKKKEEVKEEVPVIPEETLLLREIRDLLKEKKQFIKGYKLIKVDNICVNQRLLTEYEVVSNREENKDIKIKYSDFNGKRILIVDDNKLNIREMKSLLKPYNVEVVVVNSPYEMSKLLNSNVTFDLIFMDDMISSFGINDFTNEIKEIGNNILNYIKKDAKYPITTIIMVTANKGKEEEKYLKYGFSDYIIKPISKGMLDKILRKYFNK